MEHNKRNWKRVLIAGTAAVGAYIGMSAMAKKSTEDIGINEDNPYKDDIHIASPGCDSNSQGGTIYENNIKPAMDRILSFGGLLALSPVFAIVAIAIMLDDPGPVFFTQKRIGKGKHYILIHKFRSMKAGTPHDVPTHQLMKPEQYITRVGSVLRKTSLDELPQLWDIFCGRMSIIGPRPALWNQEDLIAERDKYKANEIMPGLTGIAQIRGRDELEIVDKAKLDGEYANIVKQGGIKALFFDAKIFLETVVSVLKRDGVVEGGTGSYPNYRSYNYKTVHRDDVGFEEYGCYKHSTVYKEAKKKVLITGANSYIGDSFLLYCKNQYPNITVDTVDMIDGSWREMDFSCYDTVFHVAGIAHADVGRVSFKQQKKYYDINRDLAIETAKKAKKENVSQFIFMSSMIIYGNNVIDEHTVPAPVDCYGDSKWQGDVGVRRLGSDQFKVAVLRPPMIYGPKGKGNYKALSKIAKKFPIFPKGKNRRSVLFIDNLCEFVSLLVLSGEGGIYFPQNREYANTSSLVQMIASAAGKQIYMSRMLNMAVKGARKIPGRIGVLADKAFGSRVYVSKLSQYEGFDYQKIPLEESIKRTEKSDIKRNHVLVISQYFYPETFRINDMAAEWVKRGYKVTVLTGIPNYPTGKFFDGYGYRHRRRETWNGVEIIRLPLIPRGKSGLGLAANYLSFVVSGWWWNMFNNIQADWVFTFEVSPMTQALIGCWYRKKYHIPHYIYVQDLWPDNVETVTGIHNRAVISAVNRMVDYIYHHGDQIFTASPSFADEIVKRGVNRNRVHYWPQYAEEFYKPVDRECARRKGGSVVRQILSDDSFKIVFTGNIGAAQGLDILPKAAQRLKGDYSCIKFVIVGDGRCQEQLEKEIKSRGVGHKFIMIPRQDPEVIPYILSCCDAAFLSFQATKLWEMTIPAKLQSYMACGMPVIAAARGETERIIKEAECGVCCKIGDAEGVVKAIGKMMKADLEKMGNNSRKYALAHFGKEKLMDEMDKYFL